jgi:hypothetical protein
MVVIRSVPLFTYVSLVVLAAFVAVCIMLSWMCYVVRTSRSRGNILAIECEHSQLNGL